MKGQNKLVLNAESMGEALAYWLDHTIFRDGHVVNIVGVSAASGGQFEVTLEEPAPIYVPKDSKIFK